MAVGCQHESEIQPKDLIGLMRLLCFFLLLILASVVLLWPDAAFRLAGLQPLGTPSMAELDELAGFEDQSVKPFFDERNRVEVTVPRSMPAQEFLELYLIDQPHVRDEIAEQEGWATIGDSAMLQEGRTYSITLTPPELATP